ncbi:MAG: 23S rRNA (uracil(1939)-C(5))-methyltransferase RlmD [bacterium]|nr:23S rRNA (uracil(1939)-C(5))-methyltransferase RlmD [bacterium]
MKTNRHPQQKIHSQIPQSGVSGSIVTLQVENLHENGDFIARELPRDSPSLDEFSRDFPASNLPTVYLDGVIPGERVLARISQCGKPVSTPAKKGKQKTTSPAYKRAVLLEILDSSGIRVTSPCHISSLCGGCQLMHISYSGQLELKSKVVMEALTKARIDLTFSDISSCLPSPEQFGYRQKLQLPLKLMDNGLLEAGLFRRGTKEILPLSTCLTHDPVGEDVLNLTLDHLERHFRSGRISHEVVKQLNFVLIRVSRTNRQCLLTLTATKDISRELTDVACELVTYPSISGVSLNISDRESNTVLGAKTYTLAGDEHIEDQLDGLSYQISPTSFFQVNVAMAEKIFLLALAKAELKRTDRVLDLYCGTGALSLMAARQALSVIGIESTPSAVLNAENNARLNKIANCEFLAGDSDTLLDSVACADIVFLDPPRKGCTPATLQAISRLNPRKIVYISCNPRSFARDARLLQDSGYHLKQLTPADMFPQTAHVEVVGLFVPSQ